MRPRGRQLVPLVLVASLLGAAACGGDDDDGGGGRSSAASDPSSTSLLTADAWCERYAEDLPVLASPNPDGHELEYLDLHIARADALAGGAPGVPSTASDAAGEIAEALTEVRRRVADGEALPEVLQDVFGEPDGALIAAGQAVDDGAAETCP